MYKTTRTTSHDTIADTPTSRQADMPTCRLAARAYSVQLYIPRAGGRTNLLSPMGDIPQFSTTRNLPSLPRVSRGLLLFLEQFEGLVPVLKAPCFISILGRERYASEAYVLRSVLTRASLVPSIRHSLSLNIMQSERGPGQPRLIINLSPKPLEPRGLRLRSFHSILQPQPL